MHSTELTEKRIYRQRTDLFSKVAVARLNNVSINVFQWHLDRGAFTEPSFGDKRKYYTPQEVANINAYWNQFSK